jgi:hypothetical protein
MSHRAWVEGCPLYYPISDSQRKSCRGKTPVVVGDESEQKACFVLGVRAMIGDPWGMIPRGK